MPCTPPDALCKPVAAGSLEVRPPGGSGSRVLLDHERHEGALLWREWRPCRERLIPELVPLTLRCSRLRWPLLLDPLLESLSKGMPVPLSAREPACWDSALPACALLFAVVPSDACPDSLPGSLPGSLRRRSCLESRLPRALWTAPPVDARLRYGHRVRESRPRALLRALSPLDEEYGEMPNDATLVSTMRAAAGGEVSRQLTCTGAVCGVAVCGAAAIVLAAGIVLAAPIVLAAATMLAAGIVLAAAVARAWPCCELHAVLLALLTPLADVVEAAACMHRTVLKDIRLSL